MRVLTKALQGQGSPVGPPNALEEELEDRCRRRRLEVQVPRADGGPEKQQQMCGSGSGATGKDVAAPALVAGVARPLPPRSPRSRSSSKSPRRRRQRSPPAGGGRGLRLGDATPGLKGEASIATTQPAPTKCNVASTSLQLQHGFDTHSEQSKRLQSQLDGCGWQLRPQKGDGNCFFRAVSEHVFGDPGMHSDIRSKCLDFMGNDWDHFSNYVAEDFAQYVARKRLDGCYANNPEIQATSELFNRPIEVYTADKGVSEGPINIFHGNYSADSAPIRVLYSGSNHYDAIVDLNAPSVGHGLGLPGLKSLPIDKFTMKSRIDASDIEATEREMEEAALTASLASWKEHEFGRDGGRPSKMRRKEADFFADEIPPLVQEMVVNGFPLPQVLRAYSLVGDSADDLLAILLMNV